MSEPSLVFDAIIVASAQQSAVVIAGLRADERARRAAVRVGARSTLMVRTTADLAQLTSDSAALLVIRADQLVHPPLVAGLVTQSASAVAVAPPSAAAPDLKAGEYAGALWLVGSDRESGIRTFEQNLGETALVHALLERGAKRVEHGEIARYPLRDATERKAAHKLLYRILIKAQDNAITKYLYRPVSFPISILLAKTPITPNQISYFVGVLAAIGLYFTARGPMWSALLGTVICLIASYIDCCDGEVARLKLLSSRFGAWLDTIIDEASSIGYMVAVGIHLDRYFGATSPFGGEFALAGYSGWLAVTAISVVTYLASIYFVYFNIIVVVGSANSQDYVGEFRTQAISNTSVTLVPAASQAIVVENANAVVRFLATYVPYIVRRDFISWAAVVFAALSLTWCAFVALTVGGLLTAVITGNDHRKLRGQLTTIRRAGKSFVRT